MTDKFAQTIRRRTPPKVRARRIALRLVYCPTPSAQTEFDPTTESQIDFGRQVEGIGRLDDPRLSRKHAAVGRESSGALFVEDLGGSNGTFVNGRRLEGRAPVGPNDVVSMGDTLFVVDEEPKRDALPVAQDATGDVPEVAGISFVSERHRQALATAAPRGHVLLLGGTGSGKEVSAQALHRLSGRKGALIAVNSAAIPGELADSQLFGHVKGAFTGADDDHAGQLVAADGGTLFLDEIADLPEPVQAKLLRVLEDGQVFAVGGTKSRTVDVTVIAATHKDLNESGFRKDLYARLSDWVLQLPPLNQHKADVVELWRVFLPDAMERCTPEVFEALLLHDWPMNVRELKKLAQRLDTLSSSGLIDLDLMPQEMQDRLQDRDIEEPGDYDGPERQLLQDALRKTRGNVKQAAIDNQWHRTQLYRWLKRAGIDPRQFR